MKRYLFEKLSDAKGGERVGLDPQEAIRANVQRIVASARTPFDGPDGLFGFGLESPVVLHLGGGETLEHYAQGLTRLIQRWEQRLRDVAVVVERGGSTTTPYRLVVVGHLDLGGEPEEIRFPLERQG